MSEPRETIDDQMVADWSAVGLCRLEDYLARHAAFCDFLNGRRAPDPRSRSPARGVVSGRPRSPTSSSAGGRWGRPRRLRGAVRPIRGRPLQRRLPGDGQPGGRRRHHAGGVPARVRPPRRPRRARRQPGRLPAPDRAQPGVRPRRAARSGAPVRDDRVRRRRRPRAVGRSRDERARRVAARRRAGRQRAAARAPPAGARPARARGDELRRDRAGAGHHLRGGRPAARPRPAGPASRVAAGAGRRGPDGSRLPCAPRLHRDADRRRASARAGGRALAARQPVPDVPGEPGRVRGRPGQVPGMAAPAGGRPRPGRVDGARGGRGPIDRSGTGPGRRRPCRCSPRCAAGGSPSSSAPSR